MKHLLSVIIPLYNSKKYIEKCIDSVLELHISKEIIVIDDGSTDSSCQVVKSYADNGLIKLYQQENKQNVKDQEKDKEEQAKIKDKNEAGV